MKSPILVVGLNIISERLSIEEALLEEKTIENAPIPILIKISRRQFSPHY